MSTTRTLANGFVLFVFAIAALGQSALASGGSRASLRGIIREARGCSLPALVRSGCGVVRHGSGLIIPQWTGTTRVYLRPDGFD